jgi:hypothetical protein
MNGLNKEIRRPDRIPRPPINPWLTIFGRDAAYDAATTTASPSDVSVTFNPQDSASSRV